jgi:enamine deaminase RidA (YjgF/YER057c/UK114 family)
MTIEERLRDLGLALPPAPAPAGNYVPFVRAGDLVFTAGQIAMKDGTLITGVVGRDLDLEAAKEAAKACCLLGLAVAKSAVGDLENVLQVVKVNGFVRSAPGFTDQPKVLNGASDMLVAVFGDRGRHARAAIGVSELPLGAAVEVDFIFRVK